tara:strand:+ start:1535 stop:2638 length:1104 start_codon:yes stop_codon:yes gene_type:complete
MITLNEIAYNIKNLAYGGNTSVENIISIDQIKHWIHYHRAKLIADNFKNGITEDSSLWQKFPLGLRNSTAPVFSNYYRAWDEHDINSALTAPVMTSDNLLKFAKKNGDKLTGEFNAIGGLFDTENKYGNSRQATYFGDNAKGFRNKGYHSFFVPIPVQIKNGEAIKDVEITRVNYRSDLPSTTTTDEGTKGYQTRRISVQENRERNTNAYNKFTPSDKSPEWLFSKSPMPRHADETQYAVNARGHAHITISGLEISPNFYANDNTPVERAMLWAYKADMKMILENPTDIDMIYPRTNSGGSANHKRFRFDDASTPYPLPMQYIPELIQRILQIEMGIILKTVPDILNNSMDDQTKLKLSQSGPQTQR